MDEERYRRNTRELQQAARGMRRNPTPAEAVLWEELRSRRLDGFRFRRQHPVERFILDFYCPVRKLGVEVDGSVHDAQPERDAERDAAIARAGYRVLRIRNDDVMTDLRGVLTRIRVALREPIPPPSPVIGRGGPGG